MQEACHTPKTHDDDGVFCLYVQKEGKGPAARMDAADSDVLEVLLSSAITNKLTKGHLTRRLKIIEHKFILEKGMVIIQCADQYSLEVAGIIVREITFPNKYQCSLSAFSETWQIKLAFPKEHKFDNLDRVIEELKANNGDRFKFLEELDGKYEVRGQHAIWTITVSQKEAKECLQSGEIFHYTLGSGFIMGYKADVPVLTTSQVCHYYRRTLREVLSVDPSKLLTEVTDKIKTLPKIPTPKSRTWELVAKEPSTEDSEDVKNYRDKLKEIYPGWGTDVSDTTVSTVAGWSWTTMEELSTLAEKKERKYLENYTKYSRHLKYPAEQPPLNLPKINNESVKPKEYFAAVDALVDATDISDQGQQEIQSEIAEEKLRVLQFYTSLKRRYVWASLKSTNKEIEEHMVQDSRRRSRDLMRQKEERKEALLAIGKPVEDKDLEVDDEASHTKLSMITETQIIAKIKAAREARKRKREPSPGKEAKRHSSEEPSATERIDDPTG